MKFHLFSLIITIQKKSLSEAELNKNNNTKRLWTKFEIVEPNTTLTYNSLTI